MKFILNLLVLAIFLASCQNLTDKDYLNKAEQSLKEENFTTAVEAYQSLIEEYPESNLIPGALWELGRIYQNWRLKDIPENKSIDKSVKIYNELYTKYPETDLAPKALNELALIYQNRQIKNLSEMESYIKAAATYKKLYDKYPDNDLAAYSLFMSGFLLANDPVRKYEEATETYRLFLEKFPDNELAASAKAEIENMGIPAKEILEKKIVTGK